MNKFVNLIAAVVVSATMLFGVNYVADAQQAKNETVAKDDIVYRVRFVVIRQADRLNLTAGPFFSERRALRVANRLSKREDVRWVKVQVNSTAVWQNYAD